MYSYTALFTPIQLASMENFFDHQKYTKFYGSLDRKIYGETVKLKFSTWVVLMYTHQKIVRRTRKVQGKDVM